MPIPDPLSHPPFIPVLDGRNLPRIVVVDCRDHSDTPLHRLVQSQSWVTVALTDGPSLYSMLVQHGADALVMGLCAETGGQIGILRLVRRILPGLPLLIVASASSDVTEAQIRALGITWYGVGPVKAGALKEAIHSAIDQRSHGKRAQETPRPAELPSAAIGSEGEGDQ